jgi:peroxiredoxin Q/BCP
MSQMPPEGSAAPGFSLSTDGGGTASLAAFRGRKLVIYFYPKADTPGCTKESIEFNRLRPAFEEAGAAILGVSADTVTAQDKFKAKYNLGFPLASDPAHAMLEAYGVWGEKSMYGRKYQGITRATFLIDGNGRIVKVWPHVKVEGHAEEVLSAVKGM